MQRNAYFNKFTHTTPVETSLLEPMVPYLFYRAFNTTLSMPDFLTGNQMACLCTVRILHE